MATEAELIAQLYKYLGMRAIVAAGLQGLARWIDH